MRRHSVWISSSVHIRQEGIGVGRVASALKLLRRALVSSSAPGLGIGDQVSFIASYLLTVALFRFAFRLRSGRFSCASR